MKANTFKAILIKTGIVASILLLASGVSFAQSTVTLTAAPTSTTLPDGQTVPMWGLMCGTFSGTTFTYAGGTTATGGTPCTTMTGGAHNGTWQPPLITVPSGALTITLNNNLSFTTSSGTNTLPTSLVIVGQLGGGLGAAPQRMPSPTHLPQGTTWPGTPGTTNPGDPVFTPPIQADRVRSFATEVVATGVTPVLPQVASGSALIWDNLKPGTYLIHSGTQPSIQHPMGLYGVLVVTEPSDPATPTVPQAYGQNFDKDVALLLSEIDSVQNAAVDTAVRTAGFSDALVWNGQTGECGDPAVHTCYPPAVNFDPRYYLINGVSFNRSNSAASALAVPVAGTQTRVLLRFVNAGLRMHVPSVVGLNMSLIAEDGNKLPGVPKVQSQVFLAAGKTYDMTIQPKQTTAGTYDNATYAVFDRSLALSTNNQRDGGMQAYINVGTGAAPTPPTATANPDSYFVVAGNTLVVDDPAKGLIANDVGIYGVAVSGVVPAGLTLNPNGTFTYTGSPITFTYCGNGEISGAACNTVTLAACTTGNGCQGAAPTANADAYTSNVASRLQISPPGVLANDINPSGLPLKAVLNGIGSCLSVELNPDGSFVATSAPGVSCAFTYHAVNTQNTPSSTANVALTFPTASGLTVTLKDGKTGATLPNDYRWIIEEDRTVGINPATESTPGTPVRNAAINFHTSHMPVLAQGCVGTISCEAGQTLLGASAVCDVGNGACRPGTQKTQVSPGEVHLDALKRYYISILPGDAWITDDAAGGHTMSGAQIAAGQTAVDVFLQKTPLEPAKISVFVFQDDAPLNGEVDTGGGVDVLAPNEPGLGGFNIVLLDQVGGMGDAAGQLTYDMFNEPVSNALAGRIDPTTGRDACPISPTSTDGLVGMIPTCPKYEGPLPTDTPTTPKVLSPLAGHALIVNMYPGLYEVAAAPGADRIARGEEWLQTNTLDGTKAIEAFIKAGEPGYFQEFGPGGFHVAVGFANPAIINARKPAICAGTPGGCPGSFYGQVTATRMSRTPDQRVYSSGSYDMYSFTQCYASLGAPDGDDFAFTKCDADGKFAFTGIPTGNLRVTIFDQWNDLLVDGLSTPIKAASSGPGSSDGNRMEIPVTQWRTNLYGRIFLDQNGDGVSQDTEPGLPLVPFNIRYRDGSYMGFNNTDLNGFAGFNEVFPFLNWLVVDIDSARYKMSGVHVVYDSGGPVDGTTGGGTSALANHLANTIESPTAHLPTDLRVPGARYCLSADCPASDPGFDPSGTTNPGSTGRVDPGWASTQGWQGLLGQNSFIEFAMKPFAPGENGGIKGHVLYTPTRPFDDPALLLQLSWAPAVPGVTVNLYQEGTAPDGTKSLKLVDTTKSSSWDDFAQGFRRDLNGALVLGADGNPVPNMSCPGQEMNSPFYFTMIGGTQFLNPSTPMSSDGRFKCYDGWSMLNQVQPAPYNGMYKFPSIVAKAEPTATLPTTDAWYLQLDPTPTASKTNCTICVANPDDGTPMLPAGKYVVEVIVPQGYELVKEEDRNILMGDAFTAPAVQQFVGFGNIFIMPDQAAVNAFYNRTNTLQRTTNNGADPRREGDTGSAEVFWPCVGAMRVVPDLASLFPGAGQQAAFAGASRPLCDRKEVTLSDEMTVLAKFYIFNSTHIAGHFTGAVTNDFASEFDPFSPQFGEKFAMPNVPVAMKDFSGKEISRVYTDQWGVYNGLNFSTWTVWPPSPSGYVPQMMIACMNDPGPILDTRVGSATIGQMITDPWFNPAYSNFCYEIPFMPGQTAYLDTPVIPTMAFAAGYNLPDCEYPDTTPAIKSVLGSAIPGGGNGPWVSAAGQTLTINALGDKQVLNHAYSGPQATTAPYNSKLITRHYGFGTQCTSVGGSCTAISSVTIGGVNAPVTSWSDTQITVSVPALSTAQSTCTIAQRTTPASVGTSARCGQLVITAGNGKQSIDTVTVTIAGKPPKYVTPASPSTTAFGQIEPNPLQTAIDNATPGDLIIVGPGTYRENLLMWKPIRLQGVGAESVTINADAHPAGKMDAWRKQLVCVFGLTAEGLPASEVYPGCSTAMLGRVDRIPLEAIIGWDTTGNGNLAQMLQEPTLMGAYEGAGITVLGRGVRLPAGTSLNDRFGVGAEGGFPVGYSYLTNSNTDCTVPAPAVGVAGFDYGTSNFLCNPSRIDGISVINSSQGGGAIFAHGWNHSLEVANTRVHGNHGTLTGGISIGSGEFPDPFIVGADVALPAGLPAGGLVAGQQAGYGFNRNTNVHHNAVTSNASIGDALFSGTPSAAGGVTFCVGADGYRFNNNWICGNLSTGDAGGVAHSGFINDGTISRNQILFNQSMNPTIPTHGGGLAVLGASPDRTIIVDGVATECGNTTDVDCPPGLPEGTGRNLLIDANLIMGNAAESGSGGGLRLQMVNGEEVIAFPTTPAFWNDVTVTNNIIVNNVAGWDGGGVSLQDALRVRFINNTVMSNDTTASAGVLFNTLGAPNAATPPPGCTPTPDPTQPQNPNCINPVTTSTNQAAGFVTMQHTPNLTAALPANVAGTQVACPANYGYGSGAALNDGTCRSVSLPLMVNNIFWKNRAFHVEVTEPTGSGLQGNTSVVTLVPSLNQTSTGFCASLGTDNGAPGSGGPVNYWEIGVRGDTSPTPNSGSGFTLNPRFSILTNAANYPGFNNLGSDPAVLRQYCNGARIPPERCSGVTDPLEQARCKGYTAPPGVSEFTGLPVVFALNQVTVAATVDEGNNWINLGYGPLASINPVDGQTVLGNYSIAAGSPAFNTATGTAAPGVPAPNHDFFGRTRPQGGAFDIGAVEFVVAPTFTASVSPNPLAFGNWAIGTTSSTQNLTVTNTGNSALAGGTFTFGGGTPQPFTRVTTGTFPGGAPNCGATLAIGASCTVKVQFAPPTATAFSRTLTVAYTGATVTPTPVTLTGTGVASRATVSITPTPLTITVATPLGNFGTGTGIVTLTNTAPGTGASMTVSAVGVTTTGGSMTTFFFNTGPLAGPDTCTGATLAPAASCTVTVRFTNVTSATGVDRAGTITFTDNATPTPSQSGALVGHANP